METKKCKYSSTFLITFKFGHARERVGKYFNGARRRRVLVPAAYLEKYFCALSLKSLISTIVYTRHCFSCFHTSFIARCVLSLGIFPRYCETHKIVNTRNIYVMLLCCEKTKPQTATVINLWFWGLLAYPELYCDWPVHNQHSWNFSCVHDFLSLTVISRDLSVWLRSASLRRK